MYNDLLSLKQVSLNSATYSNASKKYAIFLTEGISIYCFKSGLLKKEVVKVSSKDYKTIKFGEPEGLVFPLLRNVQIAIKEEPEFKFGSFSDIFLPSLGGGFQLLVVATSNSNVVVLKSPDISSISLSYTWENVSNVFDTLGLALQDSEFNKPIRDNKTDFIDRNINPRPYVKETQSISVLEYKKRAEWLSVKALGWSNVMKCFWVEDEIKVDSSGNERMVFLTVGTKRGLVLFRCILPDLNSHFGSGNISIFKLIETKDWVLALSWKPKMEDDEENFDGLSESGIIAIALGDGSVLLQVIHKSGEIELIDTIIQQDSTPVSILEWGPSNEFGHSYLVICKGLGFYIYNFEEKKLSSFILAHRDSISSISFSDYSHFSTASYDCNIIEFSINQSIWGSQEPPKLVPSSINLISLRKDAPTLGISTVLASPNRLVTTYTEESEKVDKMFQKYYTSRLSFSYKVPTYSFQSFKTSFYQKFKNEESRNIWDYFLYAMVYSNEEILQFINELLESQTDNKVIHYKFIIKLYYILKKKSKDFRDIELYQKLETLKLFIKENYVVNFLKSFLNFISDEKDYGLLDYQKTSITLMVLYLKQLISSNDHSQLCEKVMGVVGNSTQFEVCAYCSKEIPIGQNVECVVECPECHSEIERCSRTFLFICTPKTLNCDYCYSRSLVFTDEDSIENTTQVLDQAVFEKSSIRYQFPWIKTHDPACIFCRTPLNGLSSDDRCLFP